MADPMREKLKAFAIRIIKLYQFLVKEKQEFVISKQVLRSATSIGANVTEAKGCESRADFIHKIKISQKEALESTYWLELLVESKLIDQDVYKSLSQDCTEILKLIYATLKTAQKNKK